MEVEIIKDKSVKSSTLNWIQYLSDSKIKDILGQESECGDLKQIKVVDKSYKEDTPYIFNWQGMYKEEEGVILLKEHKDKDILELTLYHELFHVRFMSKNKKNKLEGGYECFYNFYNELYANIKSVEYMIGIVPFKKEFLVEYLKCKYNAMNVLMVEKERRFSDFIDNMNGLSKENEQITDDGKREYNEELIKNAVVDYSQNTIINIVYITACLLAIECLGNNDNVHTRYIKENIDFENITLENCEYIKNNLFKGLV